MAVLTTDFKVIRHFSNSTLMDRLEYNLKTWFDFAILRVGGWTDVSPPSVTVFGGDHSILRQVDDPSYTDGTVFESARKDWVWEAGIDYVDVNSATQNPTSPAIVYIDGTPTAPDHINYPLGRVVFASPVSSSSEVTAAYSYRNVQTYIADHAPWWNEFQYRSFRVEDTHFTQLSDGSWAINGNHRVQMPSVVIEAVPRSLSRPYQLGDGSAWVEQDVLVHVIAESRTDRNKLVDFFARQFDKSIWLFDNDQVVSAGDYPLDENGDIADSSKTFPALVDPDTGYRWKSCRFNRTQTSEIESINPRLFQGTVRMTAELILDD